MSNSFLAMSGFPTVEQAPSDMVFNESDMRDLIENFALFRTQWMSTLIDPRRDIDKECGFPATESIEPKDYKHLFDRESIATRVVEVWPNECFKVQPLVFESDDPEEITPFEERWDAVSMKLRGQSWYKKEMGNPIWEILRRADIASGIGHFGLILFGINDGKPLEQPVASINDRGEMIGTPVERELEYVRVFDQSAIKITRTETNQSHPRYGQPTEYELTLYNPSEATAFGTPVSSNTVKVHWTRVLHIADNILGNEIFAAPRMRPVYNKLLCLYKLYGGSAEMYWRGAFPGLSLETHPQLGPNPQINQTALRDQLWKYQNGLQRVLALLGMSAKTLSPQVVDPTPQIDVQITGICIQLTIPKRVFMGSERGELASGQDDTTWDERVRGRQINYIIPRLIVPFINRLIMFGVLPVPGEDGYIVEWPDQKALGVEAKARVALVRTETMAKYKQGGCDEVMAPMDFFTRILDFTEEEATEILEATRKYLGDLNPDVPEGEIVPGRAPTPPELDPSNPAFIDPLQKQGNGKPPLPGKKAGATNG